MTHWRAWLVLGVVYFIPFVFAFHNPEQARQSSSDNLSAYPWIYLRDDRPLAQDERTVEGIFTGDILCGREGKNLDFDLSRAAPWLRSADFAMGNLECVISSQVGDLEVGEKGKATGVDPILLFGAPQQLRRLREAGFDILGVGNNHAFDMGVDGFTNTLKYMSQNGIKAAGMCEKPRCADTVVIQQAGDLRIAIYSINAISTPVEFWIHQTTKSHYSGLEFFPVSTFCNPFNSPISQRSCGFDPLGKGVRT